MPRLSRQRGGKSNLVLASASPRRLALLRDAGQTVEVVESGIDETPRPSERPGTFAARMAREKALDVAMRRPEGWILGADTVVVIDDQILGKPQDAADAKRMLLVLSGRRHDVLTAFAVVDPQGRVFAERIVRTAVRFRRLSEDEIDEYVESREPFGKAGAYAVQGAARAFVAELRGSYSNVVGLPIDEVSEALRDAGVWTEEPTA